MKKTTLITSLVVAFAVVAVMGITATATHTDSNATQWDMTGSYTIEFTCTSGCAGTFPHTMDVTVSSLASGDFSGTGHYNPVPATTWAVLGNVTGSDVEMTVDYDASAYSVAMTGLIADNGTLSGTATSSTAQTFTWMSTSGAAIYQPFGHIIEPEEDEVVVGMTDLIATYEDGNDVNDDAVQWAVREGTCAAGVGTVFGNVDGHSDPYNWDGANFDAVIDTSSLDGGMYCFIFNPTDDAGQNNVRETREFWVAESMISGGGHILEDNGGKRNTWNDISFGLDLADVGDLMGSLTVQFHNTSNAAVTGGTFQGEDFTELNLFDPTSGTCTAAMNLTVNGTFNGDEGWRVVMRAGDSDGPASKDPDDTIRFELYDGAVKVYDTSLSSDFSNESTCVGTARTGLDAGNIDIQTN